MLAQDGEEGVDEGQVDRLWCHIIVSEHDVLEQRALGKRGRVGACCGS
jgi:hypothetical protein